MQVVFNRRGEVVRYCSHQGRDVDTRLTQLLWSVEGGNGHITVIADNAAQLLRRCSEFPERKEFELIHYGMDMSGTEDRLHDTAVYSEGLSADQREMGVTDEAEFNSSPDDP